MKTEIVQNGPATQDTQSGASPLAGMSWKDLQAYINSQSTQEAIDQYERKFEQSADKEIAQLEDQYNGMPAGPVKTALKGAIGAVEKQKNILADLFKNVTTYSLIAIWQTSSTEVNSINATQSSSSAEMSLDEVVENLSSEFSQFFTNVLSQDSAAITAEINSGDDETTKGYKIQSLTTTFNQHNTVLQNFGTYYSGVNNMLNNGLQGIQGSISICLTNAQSINQFLDAIATMMQSFNIG